MEFGLLGPLVVRSLNTLLPIAQGKQRAILAVLLLRANQVVAADHLMDRIWDGEPPAAARPTLHNHVKRLRRALGDEGHTRIRTNGPGYYIVTEPGELDLDRFATLCVTGRQAATQQDWSSAADQLATALSVWRGQPLMDIQCGRLTTSEVPHLREQRIAALEDRIDADLNLGRHRQVIPELQQLVAEEPLRERFCAQLMLACYRGGRQADALAAYQATRRMLVHELGIEPGTGLRQLQHAILSADPGLDLPTLESSGAG